MERGNGTGPETDHCRTPINGIRQERQSKLILVCFEQKQAVSGKQLPHLQRRYLLYFCVLPSTEKQKKVVWF